MKGNERSESEDGRDVVLLDMRNWSEPSEPKRVLGIARQGELESRRLWRLLSRSLAGYMTEMDADTAKTSVEEWARRRGAEESRLQFFQVDPDNPVRAKFKFHQEK